MATKIEIMAMAKRLNGRSAFDALSFRTLQQLAAEVVDALAACRAEQKVFAVISSSVDGWAVHRATCSDLGRELALANGYNVFTGTASQTKAQIIDREMVELGYSQDDVHLRACCRKA